MKRITIQNLSGPLERQFWKEFEFMSALLRTRKRMLRIWYWDPLWRRLTALTKEKISSEDFV